MTAHTCKQNTKITLLLGLVAIFLVLVGFSSARSDQAARHVSGMARQVTANTQSVTRMEGTVPDIAAMKRDLEWIKQTLREIKENQK